MRFLDLCCLWVGRFTLAVLAYEVMRGTFGILVATAWDLGKIAKNAHRENRFWKDSFQWPRAAWIVFRAHVKAHGRSSGRM